MSLNPLKAAKILNNRGAETILMYPGYQLPTPSGPLSASTKCICIPCHVSSALKLGTSVAQVAYPKQDAWKHQPDPKSLDFRQLALPRIMGQTLAAASPTAKQLFSKLLVAHAPVDGGPNALPACWLLSKLRRDWSSSPGQGELQ